MDGETKPSTAVASQSLKFNANYIKSVLGLLKMVEFLSLIHGIWAVMLLIASAVATADAVKLSNVFGFCQVLSSSRYSSTTCATYDAAVAFGFLSFLIVVIDAVLHFLNHRSQAQG